MSEDIKQLIKELEFRIIELCEFYESVDDDDIVKEQLENLIELGVKFGILLEEEKEEEDPDGETIELAKKYLCHILFLLLSNNRSIKLLDGQKIEDKEIVEEKDQI